MVPNLFFYTYRFSVGVCVFPPRQMCCECCWLTLLPAVGGRRPSPVATSVVVLPSLNCNSSPPYKPRRPATNRKFAAMNVHILNAQDKCKLSRPFCLGIGVFPLVHKRVPFLTISRSIALPLFPFIRRYLVESRGSPLPKKMSL